MTAITDKEDFSMPSSDIPTKHNHYPLILSIALLAVIAGCSVFFIWMQKQATDRATIAYIYQNGELIETIDLSAVEEAYTFTVEGDDGSYNVIEVRPGEIGIIEASCPDHLCMETGFIHNGTIPVVCLPNALIIEVKSAEDTGSDTNATDIDGVAS